MSKMIQIRNVPDGLHRKLKARAAVAGQSLSDYLLVGDRSHRRLPTREEMLARIHSRSLRRLENSGGGRHPRANVSRRDRRRRVRPAGVPPPDAAWHASRGAAVRTAATHSMRRICWTSKSLRLSGAWYGLATYAPTERRRHCMTLSISTSAAIPTPTCWAVPGSCGTMSRRTTRCTLPLPRRSTRHWSPATHLLAPHQDTRPGSEIVR